jgi:hypothetical protein
MSGLQYFPARGIKEGEQWPGTEIAEEIRQPQTSHRDGNYYIRQRNAEAGGKIRLDYPK